MSVCLSVCLSVCVLNIKFHYHLDTENTNLQYTVQCISEDNVTITWDFRDHDYHLNMEYECYKSGNNTGVQVSSIL